MSQLAFKMTDTSIRNLLENKVNTVQNNLLQIKPTVRFRRWDTIGHVLKWIGGTPDADDLRIINTTMNSLITQNNKQFEVNTQLNTRINHLLESVNKHEVAENKELEALQILAKLNDVNHMIENIMDAILNTKIKQPNSKLLTISELAAIQRLLTKQGVPTSTLEEALEYAQPLIATQKEKLIYILKIPQLQEQPGEILKLFSLPVNKKKIIGIFTHNSC